MIVWAIVYILIGFLIGNHGKGDYAPPNVQKANIATAVLAWPLVLTAVISGVIIFLISNLLGRIFR